MDAKSEREDENNFHYNDTMQTINKVCGILGK